MIIPVILSGGSGTRLWPLSRKHYPKQLLPLTGERTLLQEAALRGQGLEDAAPLTVICNESHRFMVAEQLLELGLDGATIVLEPEGRNTAPAAAVAALRANEGSDLLLVLPADHAIADTRAFSEAVTRAVPLAEKGRLVLFGVTPSSAESGYGYIRKGEPMEGGRGFKALEFVEKPEPSRARELVDAGDCYWNSGIFLFRADVFLDRLETFRPDILEACRKALDQARTDLDFVRLDEEAFAACPADSIDYAVMERAGNRAVVPLDSPWNDLGSWSSLMASGRADESGNVVFGDVVAQDVKDSYLHSTSRLVAAVGLSGHIVVETADAVLVADAKSAQQVKEVARELERRARTEAAMHRRVYRPWGSYETVDLGERFQVKRITVKPGGVLSLQKHHHRAEHWVVVKGAAKIIRGEEVLLLGEDQSTYIPLGETHRLENPGKIPLELIEVQTGAYLGEDDIVRMEDVYNRGDEPQGF